MQRKLRHENRERTAFHEAGHAAMAVVLKLPFHFVTIVPCDDAWGHLQHRPNRGAYGRRRKDGRPYRNIEKRIMVRLAGPMAEAAYVNQQAGRGLSTSGVDVETGEADFLGAWHLIDSYVDEPKRNAFFDEMVGSVAASMPFDLVADIAGALMKRGRLYWRACKTLGVHHGS